MTAINERMAFGVDDFCTSHGISRATFYALASRGTGPRLMKVGKRTLVSAEAAKDWRSAMEKNAQEARTVPACNRDPLPPQLEAALNEEPTGVIYAIGDGKGGGANHIKIGYTTKDVWKRLAEIKTGCPFELFIIHEQSGTTSGEKAIHRALSPWKTRGEWFVLPEELRSVLNEIHIDGFLGLARAAHVITPIEEK